MMTRSLFLLGLLCATGCAIDSASAKESAAEATEESTAAAAEESTTAAAEEDETAIPGASEAAATGGVESLRLMTYNIKHGEDSGLDLSKIATIVKASNPDILGLQEVDDGTRRSNGKHQTDELSALTGMPYRYYAPAFDFDGGKYGVAILSKYPIGATMTLHLDDHVKSANGFEPRVAAIADITAKGQTVTFVTMHASLHAEERKVTSKKLISTLGARASRAIITGDFNEKPSEDIGDALTAVGFVDTYPEKHTLGLTIPSDVPTRRIDFIYRAKAMGKTLHAWVPDTKASDHRPVGVVIPLR